MPGATSTAAAAAALVEANRDDDDDEDDNDKALLVGDVADVVATKACIGTARNATRAVDARLNLLVILLLL